MSGGARLTKQTDNSAVQSYGCTSGAYSARYANVEKQRVHFAEVKNQHASKEHICKIRELQKASRQRWKAMKAKKKQLEQEEEQRRERVLRERRERLREQQEAMHSLIKANHKRHRTNAASQASSAKSCSSNNNHERSDLQNHGCTNADAILEQALKAVRQYHEQQKKQSLSDLIKNPAEFKTGKLNIRMEHTNNNANNIDYQTDNLPLSEYTDFEQSHLTVQEATHKSKRDFLIPDSTQEHQDANASSVLRHDKDRISRYASASSSEDVCTDDSLDHLEPKPLTAAQRFHVNETPPEPVGAVAPAVILRKQSFAFHDRMRTLSYSSRPSSSHVPNKEARSNADVAHQRGQVAGVYQGNRTQEQGSMAQEKSNKVSSAHCLYTKCSEETVRTESYRVPGPLTVHKSETDELVIDFRKPSHAVAGPSHDAQTKWRGRRMHGYVQTEGEHLTRPQMRCPSSRYKGVIQREQDSSSCMCSNELKEDTKDDSMGWPKIMSHNARRRDTLHSKNVNSPSHQIFREARNRQRPCRIVSNIPKGCVDVVDSAELFLEIEKELLNENQHIDTLQQQNVVKTTKPYSNALHYRHQQHRQPNESIEAIDRRKNVVGHGAHTDDQSAGYGDTNVKGPMVHNKRTDTTPMSKLSILEKDMLVNIEQLDKRLESIYERRSQRNSRNQSLSSTRTKNHVPSRPSRIVSAPVNRVPHPPSQARTQSARVRSKQYREATHKEVIGVDEAMCAMAVANAQARKPKPFRRYAKPSTYVEIHA